MNFYDVAHKIEKKNNIEKDFAFLLMSLTGAYLYIIAVKSLKFPIVQY